MLQLLVTVGFICLFMFIKPLKHWIQRDGSWLYYVSLGTFFVTYFVLVCIPSVRRKTPGNYICLAVFTLAFSFVTGNIASFYTTNSVLVAAGVTALVCLSISLFAIQTKIDFTMCSGLLFVLVMVLFFFGWSSLIVYHTAGYNAILDAVYGGLAALLFGLFLVYDTQMIVGGRKIELSPEEYISGALQLYMDVVLLFLIILSCFGKSS
ncbi:protein lifeguard 2-like isoform X2 [Gigantopelta aegis]|nr:protein lifeguard 2-like isoform X2 [Gigantopelta aegis]